MRSDSFSASDMRCVVSTMHRRRFSRRTSSCTCARVTGSTPVVGSSRNTTLGLPRKLIAMDSRRRSPPDSCLARLPSCPLSLTAWIAVLANSRSSCLGTPLSRAKSSRCSRIVSSGQNTSCCGHTPIVSYISCIRVRIDLPATNALPPDGPYSPVSIEMTVDLPAPFGPRSAVHPLSMWSDTPLTASNRPNRFCKLRILIGALAIEASFASTASRSATTSTSSPPTTTPIGTASSLSNALSGSVATLSFTSSSLARSPLDRAASRFLITSTRSVMGNSALRRTPYFFGRTWSRYTVAAMRATVDQNKALYTMTSSSSAVRSSQKYERCASSASPRKYANIGKMSHPVGAREKTPAVSCV
mmetsp:Transcript_3557/g.10968  ORF Transcript_3557/g.10968 Transcript_3557/m.10968 type:complete len:359 (-) Transcript_3557:762-1838(-)